MKVLGLFLLPSLAFAQGIPHFNPALYSRTSALQTTSATTLYVATTGNDSNNCLSASTPCLTIQGAVNKVPKYVRHLVLINVAAGTYSAGATIMGFSPGAVSPTAPGQIVIRATLSTYATGTLTSVVSAGSACTRSTYADSVATYSVNELQGKLFQVTVSGTTHTYPIESNTAHNIVVEGILPTPQPAGNEAYSILDRATTINDVLGYAIADAGPAAGATNKVTSASSFVIATPQSPHDANDFPFVSIEYFKFSYASAKRAFRLSGSVRLFGNEFSTNAQVARGLTGVSQFAFIGNTLNTAQSGLIFSAAAYGSLPSIMQVYNNVALSVSDATFLQALAAGGVYLKYNYVVGSGIRLAGVIDGNSVCDIYKPSTGRCFDFRSNSASNTCSGTFNFDGLACTQTNSGAIQAIAAGPGNCFLTFDKNSIANSSITSGGGTGGLFIANGGAQISLSTGMTLASATPSNNDFTLNDGTTGMTLTAWNNLGIKSLETYSGARIYVVGATSAGDAIVCDDTVSGCADATGIYRPLTKYGSGTCSSSTKDVTFTTPAFSATPTSCTCTESSSTASNNCTISAKSSTGITVKCVGASDSFDYQCFGRP